MFGGGRRGSIKHLGLLPADLRIQEAGFHWQGGFKSKAWSFLKSHSPATHCAYTLVKHMNNRVVLINQSSAKPSADGREQWTFLSERFLETGELSVNLVPDTALQEELKPN